MSLITFLESILPFLFKAARREYDSLPKETQDAILHGSGVVDVINREIGKPPAEIREAIQTKYPDLDEAKLEAGIFGILHAFNIGDGASDLDGAIGLLQTYLSTLKGKVWDAVMSSAANIFAIIIAPEETVFAKVTMIMEFVYRKFIKKS